MKSIFYVLSFIFLGCAHSPNFEPTANWVSYSNSKSGSKFSNLKQIHKENVKKLGVLWRWQSPDQKILDQNNKVFTMYNEATPLAIDGYLYVSTSLSQVAKIDGATGKTIWIFDPKSYLDVTPPNMGFVHRGLSYWESRDKTERRLFIGTGNAYLFAIDLESGKPINSFGDSGRVDLLKGLNQDGSDWPDHLRWHYSVTSPGVVCKDYLILGSSIVDEVTTKNTASGAVRAFDVRTGKIVWRFETNKTDGNSNVWSPMSADENHGLVYLPVSSPANDWYGGERPGKNLFSNSLVCIECLSGKLRWFYQTTHHDVWDYDLPAAPNLIEVFKDGIKIEAVAQVTKQSYVFVFDRLNGKPIWPIIEKISPASDLEILSKTQPHPTLPKAFDRQGITTEDLVDFTPELKNETLKVVQQYKFGPLYTPATDQKKGTLLLPGINGGANWSGASYSAQTNQLFVTSMTDPWVALLAKQTRDLKGTNPEFKYLRTFVKSFVTNLDGSRRLLPLIKPPYGRLTAIDLTTGELSWQIPLGVGPKKEFGDALKGTRWENSDLGWPRRSHMLLTEDLLFVGQSGTFNIVGFSEKNNAVRFRINENLGEQNLKAVDIKSGQVMNEINLNTDQSGRVLSGVSGNAYGAPMTFLNSKNRQVIVVPVGGANLPAELVAIGLKD